MSLEGLLNSTCTISRFTASGVDVHGQPTGSWADLATEVKCRIQEMALQNNWRNELNQAVGTAIDASHKMWMRYDQAVTEKDRVTTVVCDADSTAYTGLTFDVQYVAAAPGGKRHHKEVWVKVIR